MDELENTPIQKLLDRQQELKKKLVQAHRAGMSNQIVGQIQSMVEQVEFEIYNQSEMEKLKYNQDRNNDDDDDFIIG